ncbi:hypothetical protein EFE32_12345 [Lactococcus lactis subsp. lactis]|uniref:hypothetical protein n=1 Tax=Lactococcus lactis TaxID=1358 RepID=UPI00223AD1BD|nr:hypothetical protein [Lactococcus lactis]MCT0017564.1 hypothetical protein [Lactococcus lactis subsp. lactis]
MIQTILTTVTIIFVLYRQLSEQAVKHKTKYYIIIILIGLFSALIQYHQINWNTILVIAIIIGDITFPALLGWLRAKYTRIWVNNDQLVTRKGNFMTIILWLIYIFIHGLISYFIKDNENFMLFSIGISLLVQREVIWIDSQKKYPEQIKNNESIQKKKK